VAVARPWARHLARFHPRVLAVARAVQRVRHVDPDAEAHWQLVMAAPTSPPCSGPPSSANPVRAGRRPERRCPQLVAFFTSAPILSSSAAVSSVSAQEVGHMLPSSRFAVALKPNVAYLSLNFDAGVKKQTTLPSLA
jgi:hypothetical protein